MTTRGWRLVQVDKKLSTSSWRAIRQIGLLHRLIYENVWSKCNEPDCDELPHFRSEVKSVRTEFSSPATLPRTAVVQPVTLHPRKCILDMLRSQRHPCFRRGKHSELVGNGASSSSSSSLLARFSCSSPCRCEWCACRG